MSSSDDKILNHLPKLSADGENWVNYKDRLLLCVTARGLLSYLDGTETKPVDPKSLTGRGDKWSPKTADEAWEVEAYKVAVKDWTMNDANARQHIAATIPESLQLSSKNAHRWLRLKYSADYRPRSVQRKATFVSTSTSSEHSMNNLQPWTKHPQTITLWPPS